MCFSCLCIRRRSPVIPPDEAVAAPPTLSDASTLDSVRAPLYRPSASDISARRATTAAATAAATATRPPPEYASGVRIAGRRASTWEESLADEASGSRSSASCIAGRRATKVGDGPPAAVTGADRQKMGQNAELGGECWPPTDVNADPNITSRAFTFDELATATLNFTNKCLLGAGGCARVYKGHLQDGQVVAVKLMHRDGFQHRQFVVEALTLSRLHHPNLVNLIGYCADGDRRLLVYEYMPLGSLEDHLHGDRRDREPLDWNTRMKIAADAARGLEYLHEKANPQVIYRDLKPSNILLNEEYQPKLSDFGLAKNAPTGGKAHTTTAVRGTFGFWAPEYVMSGHLTKKSDVYSFGVVLLELITGLTVIDEHRPEGEQNLVEWARTLFQDPHQPMKLADPRLRGRFPKQVLHGALAIACMCIQENAAHRPTIGDVVNRFSDLADHANDPNPNGKCDRTRVEGAGGHHCKRELEGLEEEDSRRDTASLLPGSLEKEMWGVKLAGKEANRINTDGINQSHGIKAT